MAAIDVSVARGSMTTISGLMRIAHHPLPEDRMGDAQIAADEHDDVRLFEVGVRVRRRVEAERLLVGDDGRGHALPRVAVAVQHAHAELGERAEQGHFLGDDLAGAQEGDRVRAVLCSGSPSCDRRTCGAPRPSSTGSQLAGRVSQQRRHRAIGRVEHGERFPTLRARHAEIHRIVRGGRQARRLRRRADGC